MDLLKIAISLFKIANEPEEIVVEDETDVKAVSTQPHGGGINKSVALSMAKLFRKLLDDINHKAYIEETGRALFELIKTGDDDRNELILEASSFFGVDKNSEKDGAGEIVSGINTIINLLGSYDDSKKESITRGVNSAKEKLNSIIDEYIQVFGKLKKFSKNKNDTIGNAFNAYTVYTKLVDDICGRSGYINHYFNGVRLKSGLGEITESFHKSMQTEYETDRPLDEKSTLKLDELKANFKKSLGSYKVLHGVFEQEFDEIVKRNKESFKSLIEKKRSLLEKEKDQNKIDKLKREIGLMEGRSYDPDVLLKELNAAFNEKKTSEFGDGYGKDKFTKGLDSAINSGDDSKAVSFIKMNLPDDGSLSSGFVSFVLDRLLEKLNSVSDSGMKKLIGDVHHKISVEMKKALLRKEKNTAEVEKLTNEIARMDNESANKNVLGREFSIILGKEDVVGSGVRYNKDEFKLGLDEAIDESEKSGDDSKVIDFIRVYLPNDGSLTGVHKFIGFMLDTLSSKYNSMSDDSRVKGLIGKIYSTISKRPNIRHEEFKSSLAQKGEAKRVKGEASEDVINLLDNDNAESMYKSLNKAIEKYTQTEIEQALGHLLKNEKNDDKKKLFKASIDSVKDNSFFTTRMDSNNNLVPGKSNKQVTYLSDRARAVNLADIKDSGIVEPGAGGQTEQVREKKSVDGIKKELKEKTDRIIDELRTVSTGYSTKFSNWYNDEVKKHISDKMSVQLVHSECDKITRESLSEAESVIDKIRGGDKDQSLKTQLQTLVTKALVNADADDVKEIVNKYYKGNELIRDKYLNKDGTLNANNSHRAKKTNPDTIDFNNWNNFYNKVINKVNELYKGTGVPIDDIKTDSIEKEFEKIADVWNKSNSESSVVKAYKMIRNGLDDNRISVKKVYQKILEFFDKKFKTADDIKYERINVDDEVKNLTSSIGGKETSEVVKGGRGWRELTNELPGVKEWSKPRGYSDVDDYEASADFDYDSVVSELEQELNKKRSDLANVRRDIQNTSEERKKLSDEIESMKSLIGKTNDRVEKVKLEHKLADAESKKKNSFTKENQLTIDANKLVDEISGIKKKMSDAKGGLSNDQRVAPDQHALELSTRQDGKEDEISKKFIEDFESFSNERMLKEVDKLVSDNEAIIDAVSVGNVEEFNRLISERPLYEVSYSITDNKKLNRALQVGKRISEDEYWNIFDGVKNPPRISLINKLITDRKNLTKAEKEELSQYNSKGDSINSGEHSTDFTRRKVKQTSIVSDLSKSEKEKLGKFMSKVHEHMNSYKHKSIDFSDANSATDVLRVFEKNMPVESDLDKIGANESDMGLIEKFKKATGTKLFNPTYYAELSDIGKSLVSAISNNKSYKKINSGDKMFSDRTVSDVNYNQTGTPPRVSLKQLAYAIDKNVLDINETSKLLAMTFILNVLRNEKFINVEAISNTVKNIDVNMSKATGIEILDFDL